MTYEMLYLPMVLTMFAGNTNVTTQTGEGQDLSPEMKVFYSDYLIDMAEPELVHDQFGQKHPIPKGRGKTIEFRKYKPLGKALTPLTEGVTPQGQKLHVSTIEATIDQYGGYIESSQEYNYGGITSRATREGDRVGAGVYAGYTYMLGPHFNLEFGLGAWAGVDWYDIYSCQVCGLTVDSGNGLFVLPDDIMVSVVYVF